MCQLCIKVSVLKAGLAESGTLSAIGCCATSKVGPTVKAQRTWVAPRATTSLCVPSQHPVKLQGLVGNFVMCI
jgi:hypothetical protein